MVATVLKCGLGSGYLSNISRTNRGPFSQRMFISSASFSVRSCFFLPAFIIQVMRLWGYEVEIPNNHDLSCLILMDHDINDESYLFGCKDITNILNMQLIC